MRRTFASRTEFDAWHADAKVALGLPRIGANARSGKLAPDKQQTTDWTALDRDEDGNLLTTAEVAPDSEPHREDVATLVRADMLTADELAALANVFDAWQPDTAYGAKAVVSHGGKVWTIIQPHTSQVGWEPPNVPALWRDTAPPDVIPQWVQPTGGHDAYQTGDRVTFEGQVWESTIDANVWSPTTYPAGWALV